MPAGLILAVYGSSVLAAVLLLYMFRAQKWYWHVLSVAAALAIGLAPPPPELAGPVLDMVTGFFFLLLFTWGVGAPFFRRKTMGGEREPRVRKAGSAA